MDVADPIPPSVKALVDLFKNELSAVTFPGVDSALLLQLLADVQKYTDAVIKAEATLDAARTALRESEEALAVKSQKALAYARVYAEDHPDIAAKVDFVSRVAGVAPAPSDAPKRERDRDGGSDAPKRRGRKPRTAAAESMDATPVAPAVEALDMTPAASAVMIVSDVSVEEIDASELESVAN
jgi:ElaB/YqjD/DUF883 family membrane-anchored ribosome-binding protein